MHARGTGRRTQTKGKIAMKRARRRERERERKRINTRAKRDTRTTRKRRHACDPSRGTATTEPFQTSTSRRAPPPHAHHVVLNPPVDPLRRPLTTLFLSRSRSPSVVYHSFSLPFVAPTISILFYFVILVPRRSTSRYVDSVCDRFGFYLPSVSLLLPPSFEIALFSPSS